MDTTNPQLSRLSREPAPSFEQTSTLAVLQRDRLLEAAENLPGLRRLDVDSIVRHLEDAPALIDRTRAALSTALGEPGRTQEWRQKQVEATLGPLRERVNHDLQAATARAESLRSALEKSWLPPRPKDTSDHAYYSRKSDLVRLLDAVKEPQVLIERTRALAREASARNDALTLAILSSDELSLYWEARSAEAGRGPDRPDLGGMVREQLRRDRLQEAVDVGDPSAQFFARVYAGEGPGQRGDVKRWTMDAALVCTGAVVDHRLQQLERDAAAAVGRPAPPPGPGTDHTPPVAAPAPAATPASAAVGGGN
jgi:hypothetical protein